MGLEEWRILRICEIYGLLLNRLLILCLAHRRDVAYVTLAPAVTGALTTPAAPHRPDKDKCPPCFNCQLPAFKCGNVCPRAVSWFKADQILTPHSMVLVANMMDSVNALKGGVVSTA